MGEGQGFKKVAANRDWQLKKRSTILKEKIEQSLNNIRKYLQADGGDVELVSEENGYVKVRLTGACGSCPMATMTLRNVVEEALRADVPEIKSVEQVM